MTDAINSRQAVGRIAVSLREVVATVAGLSAGGLTYGTEAPTSGAHDRGEVVFSSEPEAGGLIGWVCIEAGTPGVWKEWGVISL